MELAERKIEEGDLKSFQRILFIDDCEDTNYLHTEYAKMVDENLIVYTIGQSSKVIDFLGNSTRKQGFPDLIFMDINLPYMDGFDLLEAYVEKGYHLAYPTTKIFMLSAIEHSKDKKKLEKFPFVSGHLLKPLNDEVLVKILKTIKTPRKVYS